MRATELRATERLLAQRELCLGTEVPHLLCCRRARFLPFAGFECCYLVCTATWSCLSLLGTAV